MTEKGSAAIRYTELTGLFALDESVVDPGSVMLVVDDAREEEIQRRLRLAR